MFHQDTRSQPRPRGILSGGAREEKSMIVAFYGVGPTELLLLLAVVAITAIVIRKMAGKK